MMYKALVSLFTEDEELYLDVIEDDSEILMEEVYNVGTYTIKDLLEGIEDGVYIVEYGGHDERESYEVNDYYFVIDKMNFEKISVGKIDKLQTENEKLRKVVEVAKSLLETVEFDGGDIEDAVSTDRLHYEYLKNPLAELEDGE